jgi:hypothetical protein
MARPTLASLACKARGRIGIGIEIRDRDKNPEPIFLNDFMAIYPVYTSGISAKHPRVPQGGAFS